MESNQATENTSIIKGRVDSINIYEVTESELESLESATPTGIFFDIGLICLTIAISFTISLSTTTISDDRTFNTFLIITVIGYLGFLAFTVFWILTRKSIKEVTTKIRNRIDPNKNTLNKIDSTE